ncbi:glycoside hydrolase family 3 N-terminal domain-containing protein [Lacticaseibacillus parahuelsenbergensis]|uniref:beta-N-acetylhexosaminidase n=1 Tax=Lacticaseibacillus parahuelsenbergensis TaxID=3068305 RepID=A0ABY9L5E9_9LACO|nr:glycoside hydrolase family 3 N-terminal domain-containing protein [Lacticaseibacillus sp. NCIMB 15471]WLV78954.1 glycoside hydrolase family 3 N-terminal domain-containing protein [Lacticaseibacillus sp. NCIMB 15471]
MKKFGKRVASILGCGVLLLGSIGLSSSASVAHAAGDQPISDAELNQYISKMSLDEKIGQMFVSRTPQDTAQARADVAKYHLGGLIVYGADFTSVEGSTPEAAQTAFKNKLQSFQDSAKLPLLIGVDQEGGSVSRLSQNPLIANGRAFPSPQALFAEGGMAKVTQEAQQVGTILKNLGINWNYAPVADSTADTDSFIYPRTIGQDYTATADYISQVVPAWQNTGIAATVKHFPGYGSAVDTHTDFAVVTKSEEAFEKEDLLPFKAGIDAGVDSIMIAHIVMQSVDPVYPASLSKRVVTDLLRDKLGYKGLIITDALGMGAITKFAASHNNVPVDVLAVAAGNDCIMNDDYATAIPQIHQAVTSGQLSEQAIDQHVFRILSLKRKLGLLTAAQLETKQVRVDNVAYDQAKKTATVSGTVVDSNWQTGEPLTVKDDQGHVVATADVGAGGKFNFTIPLTVKAQQLTLTTGLPGIEDAQVTIEPLQAAKVDKTALQSLVNLGAAYAANDYTSDSWGKYQVALTAANQVLTDQEATQAAVDHAAQTLQKAITELVKANVKINKDALQQLVDQVLAYDAKRYTNSTWTKLEAALAAAKQVLADKNATQPVIDHAVQVLKAAATGLETQDSEAGQQKKVTFTDKKSPNKVRGDNNVMPRAGEKVVNGLVILGVVLILTTVGMIWWRKARD